MNLESILIAIISATGGASIPAIVSWRANKSKVQAEAQNLKVQSDVSVAEISLKIIEEVKSRAKELKGDIEGYRAREHMCRTELDTMRTERDHYRKDSEECNRKLNNK
jgi:hypothetical protein